MWLLCAVPVLTFAVNIAVLMAGHVVGFFAVFAVGAVATVALVVADSRYLRRRGYEVAAALGVVFLPACLWARAKRLGRSHRVLAVWAVTLTAGIVASFAAGSRFATLDMGSLEADITSNLLQRMVPASAVRCPSAEMHPLGSTFECEVSTSDGARRIVVRVRDSRSVSWSMEG